VCVCVHLSGCLGHGRKLGIQTDGGEETYIVRHRFSSLAMNSTSLDCNSLATVRSLGGAELEYDLWEGQFTFSQPTGPGLQQQIHDNASVVHFFKSEYHTLINKVIFLILKSDFFIIIDYISIFVCILGSNTPATDYRPG
jgi:hypothetical protein